MLSCVYVCLYQDGIPLKDGLCLCFRFVFVFVFIKIGHLSRMAFASCSEDNLSATQGSEELLTNHSTLEEGKKINVQNTQTTPAQNLQTLLAKKYENFLLCSGTLILSMWIMASSSGSRNCLCSLLHQNTNFILGSSNLRVVGLNYCTTSSFHNQYQSRQCHSSLKKSYVWYQTTAYFHIS